MGLRPLLHALPFLRRYRGVYLVGLAALVATIGLRLAVPVLLGGAIDDLRLFASPGAQATDADFARSVGRAALAIVAAAVVGAGFRTASRITILGACRRVVHDLRAALFDKLARLAPSFYLRYTTGQLMSRAMNDAQNVQGLAGPVFMYITETAILYVIGIGLMLATDPLLSLWTLAPFPFFIWRARSLARRIQESSRAAQDSLGRLSERVSESLSGQLVLKTLALEAFDLARFESHAAEYRELNLEVTRARVRLMPLMTALVGLSLGLALVFGRQRVTSGALTGGELVSFLFFLRYLAAPTATLGFVISSLQRGAAALGRIQEIFDAEETLPRPRPLSDLDPPRASDRPRGAIEVRGLTLVREGLVDAASAAEPATGSRGAPALQRRTVLRDLSFSVEPGETLGIVGHTGSGKSTLIEVLARLLEVGPGVLFYDGRDATELDPLALRQGLGWVPQEAFLFSATLRENLLLARPDAEPEELDRAVRIAQLAKDLPQLPRGLDTLVGERGVTLSGGQRQRAALARAILARPTVMLIDDTLSAVDTETADAILEGLRPVMASRTTVIVSHRLSTVKHADRILVLEDGRIIEQGDHARLLELGGTYADLWRSQERRPEEARG